MTLFRWLGFALCLLQCACASVQPDAIAGPAAYDVLSAAPAAEAGSEYRIRPLDVLSLKVFGEPELTTEQLTVDAQGTISLPLVGSLRAEGRTTAELGSEIAARLERRFLVDPQVAVNIRESAALFITVEGEVEQPGVFPVQGETTLLRAVALARGPTELAKLDQVLVFRQRGSERLAARFDLRQIRNGFASDPTLQANDVVVVGYSQASALFRTSLAALPALGTIFVLLNSTGTGL